MKRFVSTSQLVLRHKLAVGLAILVILGAIGAGRFLLLSQSRGSIDNAYCLSHTQNCNAPHLAQATHHTLSPTAEQTDNQQSVLAKIYRPGAEIPAPTSAQKVTPTPVPTNPPVVTTPTTPANPSSVTGMIEQTFGSYAQQALRVAKCESGLNANAYNPTSIGGSHAEGVFQILYPSTWRGTSQAALSPYNAQANIHAAYEIFARDGYNWHEWSCAS